MTTETRPGRLMSLAVESPDEGIKPHIKIYSEGRLGPEREPKKIEVVAYDLDDTLIKNRRGRRASFIMLGYRTFKNLSPDIKLSRRMVARHFDKNPDFPSREQMESLADSLGIDIMLPDVQKAISELYNRASKRKGPPMPFAVVTLKDLKKDLRVRNAISTGAREEDAREKLIGTGLKRYISTVVGSTSTPDGRSFLPTPSVRKGDPQFEIIAKRLGYPDYPKFKRSLLFVSDTPDDIYLALNSGVDCFGVSEDALTRVWMIQAGNEVLSRHLETSPILVVRPSLQELKGFVEMRNYVAAIKSKSL